MTATLAAPVDPAGIAEADVLYYAGQLNFTDLDHQVDMIGHEAKGVDAMSVAFCSFWSIR